MNKGAERVVARQRFRQARRQAELQQLTARITGRDTRLLSFDDVRMELRQRSPLYRGVQEVSLDSIVGSVGRYKAFTREFLPLTDSLEERWVGVDTLAVTKGWPPIELYQVGNVYFVKDGNHRVSVAKQMELATIEAHVWEFTEEITFDPDADMDELFIQLGERNFLEKTGLAERHPDHNIRFTSPGRNSELLAQIEDLRHKLADIDGEMMSYADAVDAWYEMIYLPTVQIIQDSTLLTDFAGRTEADLFVWLSQHRDRVRAHYGDSRNLAELAQMLADQYKEGGLQKVSRQVRRLLGDEALPPLVEADDEIVENGDLAMQSEDSEDDAA
jgi:hypothetical protein